jgi:hypothetical protein
MAVMQQIDREAEWLVAIADPEPSADDLDAVMDHWLLEDFADILPQSARDENVGT